MTAALPPQGPVRHRSPVPFLVLSGALLLTICLTLLLGLVVQRKEQARFDNAVKSTEDRIRNRLDTYVALLLGLSGFFHAQDQAGHQVSSAAFHAYLQQLGLREHYPGVQGIGFCLRMPAAQRDALVASLRSEVPQFHLWPEAPRPEYFPVAYIAPLDRRNRAAIGYDMFSDPVRGVAMAQARDTALPSASGKVTLVQEIDEHKQAGLLIFVPVYSGTSVPASLAGRREDLLGFVYSPFRADDLFGGIFGSEADPFVDFDVFDGTEATPRQLLHASFQALAGPSPAYLPRFTTTTRLSIAGHPWTLRFSSVAAFDAASGLPVVPAAGLLGLMVSLVLFTLTSWQVRAREQAELIAADLLRSEEALRHSEAQLSALVEQLAEESRSHATLRRIAESFAKDLDQQRLVQRITDEATALCEAQFGAFFHNQVNEQGKSFLLYALSGAAQNDFAHLPMPRATDLFLPTFRGEGIVRLDDVTKDPRHGRNPPYSGLPGGHPQVRSYLAVPVISGSGEVLGGLMFGHAEPGRFTPAHEQVMAGVAAQAAVALDNARLYQKARQAVQLRDEFLSIASHELKTPVTSLQLYLDNSLRIMKRQWTTKELSAEQRERIEAKLTTATRQTQRLTQLIDQLLDVSRITAGRLEFELEEMDLCALVREVAERFEQEAERSGCEIRLHCAAPVAGRWDRLRLDQVVSNLLQNALKYGPGKPVEVDICADDESAEVRVRDHGIGIAPEDQTRLFARFERLVSSRHFGGFGLGLWICRQIVEGLGGHIKVESAVSEGSAFIINLPYRN